MFGFYGEKTLLTALPDFGNSESVRFHVKEKCYSTGIAARAANDDRTWPGTRKTLFKRIFKFLFWLIYAISIIPKGYFDTYYLLIISFLIISVAKMLQYRLRNRVTWLSSQAKTNSQFIKIIDMSVICSI